MRWYIPSWNGDFRLVEEGGEALLVVHDPTALEITYLDKFLGYARGKGWTAATEVPTGNGAVKLSAKVSEAGIELVRIVSGNRRASITAVKHTDGKLDVTETLDPKLAEKVKKAEKDDPDAKAATTKRATPCCPSCQPGAIEPASEVLLAFLTPEQHKDWAKHRVIEVVGGLTGHRYLLAHRNSKHAQSWTRVCFDTDDGKVLKFYDWTVPPEEEVLSAMLILQTREHWLRNEATVFGMRSDGRPRLRYKNPFGGVRDGTETSAALGTIGGQLQSLAGIGGFGLLEGYSALVPMATYPNPIQIVPLPNGSAGRVMAEEETYDGSGTEVRQGNRVLRVAPIVG